MSARTDSPAEAAKDSRASHESHEKHDSSAGFVPNSAESRAARRLFESAYQDTWTNRGANASFAAFEPARARAGNSFLHSLDIVYPGDQQAARMPFTDRSAREIGQPAERPGSLEPVNPASAARYLHGDGSLPPIARDFHNAGLAMTRAQDVRDDANPNKIFVSTRKGNGSDALGSRNNPYTSIQSAVDRAQPGSVVQLVREGNDAFHERVTINRSGIVLQTDPSNPAVFDMSSSHGNGDAAITVGSGASGVRIKNFEIRNFTGLESAIRVEGSGIRDVTISGNDIHSARGAEGIAVYGKGATEASKISGVNVISNTIHDLKLGAKESLPINGNVDGFRVAGNVSYNNDNLFIDAIGGEGTSRNAALDQARNGLIEYNFADGVSSSHNPAYKGPAAAGIYSDGGKNLTIRNNYIRNSDFGIEVSSEHTGKVRSESVNAYGNVFENSKLAWLTHGGANAVSGGSAFGNVVIGNSEIESQSGGGGFQSRENPNFRSASSVDRLPRGIAEMMNGASRPDVVERPAQAQPADNLNIADRTTLPINLSGSLQNPSWAPDGNSIAFTRFRSGYNRGAADVFVYNLQSRQLTTLAADGSQNVTQPGSTWTKDGRIVFSSDRGSHEEIYSIKADGSERLPTQLTARNGLMAYEPSLSPDGRAIAFESHVVDQSGNGRIAIKSLDGSNNYQYITPEGQDSRQPSWSPSGESIIYQRNVGGQWNVWNYDVRSGQQRQLTHEAGGATDATFSPDGKYVLFSKGGGAHDNLYAMPATGGDAVPVTRSPNYDGAASWSPNGRYVAMESSPTDPDRGPGTKLVVAPVRNVPVEKRGHPARTPTQPEPSISYPPGWPGTPRQDVGAPPRQDAGGPTDRPAIPADQIHLSDQVLNGFTVRRGEGPYQSVERVFGNTFSHEERMQICQVLKQQYAEDIKHDQGNSDRAKDMSDLRVGYKLVRDDNIGGIISKLQQANPEILRKIVGAGLSGNGQSPDSDERPRPRPGREGPAPPGAEVEPRTTRGDGASESTAQVRVLRERSNAFMTLYQPVAAEGGSHGAYNSIDLRPHTLQRFLQDPVKAGFVAGAVDPRYTKLGSMFDVPEYNEMFKGKLAQLQQKYGAEYERKYGRPLDRIYFGAVDTGGAIKGRARVDVCVEPGSAHRPGMDQLNSPDGHRFTMRLLDQTVDGGNPNPRRQPRQQPRRPDGRYLPGGADGMPRWPDPRTPGDGQPVPYNPGGPVQAVPFGRPGETVPSNIRDPLVFMNSLLQATMQRARALGTVGQCAQGVREGLNALGIGFNIKGDMPGMGFRTATELGEHLYRTGLFERVPLEQMRGRLEPGMIAVRHWNASVIRGDSERKDRGDIAVIGRNGMQYNDHAQSFPGDGGRYVNSYVLIPKDYYSQKQWLNR